VISRICICCGEPFSYYRVEEKGNPNICKACSQLSDTLKEPAPLGWEAVAVLPDLPAADNLTDPVGQPLRASGLSRLPQAKPAAA
jgi:hypothetical protein